MAPQLILVEGIPSSGKSTTSQQITRFLEAQGQAARWVWEPEVLNHWFARSRPVYTAANPDVAALLADWQALIAAVAASDQTWITDGALSFTLITPLLGADLPFATRQAAIAQLWAICAPVTTNVVHVVGDVATLLNTSYDMRGPWWRTKITEQVAALPHQQARDLTGEAGTIAFYEQVQPMLTTFFDPTWPVLTIDRRTIDRPSALAAIAEFLGYPAPEPAPIASFLPQYLGCYRALDPSNESPRLCIEQQPHALMLTDGSKTIGSLDILAPHELQMAGTPYRFTFSPQSPALIITLADGTQETYEYEGLRTED